MNPFDEMPGRDRNHEVEDLALAAFQLRLAESGCFILQGHDRKDYGVDCHIEVSADGQATNVRVQVQLKGTEQSANLDGSISVSIQRKTINYLMMEPYSFFACYHVPTQSLRICPANTVFRQYEHSGKNWTKQETLTVSFREEMPVSRLQQLAALARASAMSSRDRRNAQTSASSSALPNAVLDAVPDIYVPDDKEQARALIAELYNRNADEEISAGFDKFAAVLGDDDDAMGFGYMAEINLGMSKLSQHRNRIKDGISFFERRIDTGRFENGSLLYTVANGFTALGDDDMASRLYDATLDQPGVQANPDLAAQVHKNLGTCFEHLGQMDKAVEHYQEALRLSPNLPEAHNAMGNYYVRIGSYEDALQHFDRVVFAERRQRKTSSVIGWRANVLFNLGRGQDAFREINALVGQADRLEWVWPWCCRLVATFGRTSIENAIQARAFWERFIQAHPESSRGRWELLMSNFYLRGQHYDIGKTYDEFKVEFDRQIVQIDPADAALPWDRLGHWAQEDGNWVEAERCFRIAHALEGDDYGYCLGVALNQLDRFEESLPLLLEQARTIQPDARSWYQVGVALMHLGETADAITAMEAAFALDEDFAPALFDLGGLYWNSGNQATAREIWTIACERFPDDPQADQARPLLQ